MLKQYSYGIKRIIIFVDVITFILSFWLAGFIRFGIGRTGFIKNHIWILVLSSFIIPVCFTTYGLYDFRYKTFGQCVNKIILSHGINLMVISFFVYLFKVPHFSRVFLVSIALISMCIHVFSRLWIKNILNYFRIRGYNYRRTLIVGISDAACRIISSIEKNAQWGLRIVGIIKEENEGKGHPLSLFGKYPVWGSFKELKSILLSEAVDNVIFCNEKKNITDLKETILALESMGISSHVAIPNPTVKISSTFLGNIDGIPLITYQPIKLSPLDVMMKNLVDIIGGAVGFFIFILLYPIIGLAIKLESPGPVLFKQKRMGENGRIFTLYKFRTMYKNAEERKKELMKKNQLNGAVFKIKNDPRITFVGRFLRKFSLDEWPQFINVINRKMSLVGTRPPTLDEVVKYDIWHRRRLSMKPGMTGLWQVSGRNAITDFDEIVKLDLKYIDNWSIWYDFYIIGKTLLIALRKGEAY